MSPVLCRLEFILTPFWNDSWWSGVNIVVLIVDHSPHSKTKQTKFSSNQMKTVRGTLYLIFFLPSAKPFCLGAFGNNYRRRISCVFRPIYFFTILIDLSEILNLSSSWCFVEFSSLSSLRLRWLSYPEVNSFFPELDLVSYFALLETFSRQYFFFNFCKHSTDLSPPNSSYQSYFNAIIRSRFAWATIRNCLNSKTLKGKKYGSLFLRSIFQFV